MTQWRVTIGRKEYGPYSLDKMRQIYEEGRIPADAQVWHPQQKKWVTAELVAELRGSANGTPLPEEPTPIFEEPPETQAATVPPVDPESFSDFVGFRRMVTPTLVKFLFWVGAILSSVGGLILMLITLQQGNGGGLILGFVIMLAGPVIVRIACELLMVLFQIQQSLAEIRTFLKDHRPDNSNPL